MMQHWQPRERLDTVLDACIDQLDVSPPDRLLLRYPQSAPALRPVLHVAAALYAMSQLQLSPSARQLGRERLMRAVLAQRRRARRPRLPAGITRLALWSAALLLMIATGLSGVTVASATALPNERLYGWKRASEDVWLRVQPSPERAAAVALGLVDRRVEEARLMFQRTGHLPVAAVAAIGQSYSRSLELIAVAQPAQRQQLIDALHSASEQHATRLAALAEQASGEDRAILSAAVAVTEWARTAGPDDSQRVPQPLLPRESGDPSAPPATAPAPPATAPDAAPPGRAPAVVPPRAQPPAKEEPPRNDSQAPGNDSSAPPHDSPPPGNAPAEPPGQSNKPAEPPGQEKQDRSADATPTPALVPDPAPTTERGSSESAPGRSDNPPPGQERKAEPTVVSPEPTPAPPVEPEPKEKEKDDRDKPEDPGNGGQGRNKP
jgi:hypothetical protein